ncbi:MAG: hypothetical protein LBK82_14035 [Planctomycetaceae bacterium]|nr:hypothetical protein [Planctomycetaceae bacterium]
MVLESNYQTKSGTSRLSPTRPWVKALQRTVAHLPKVAHRCLPTVFYQHVVLTGRKNS